MEFTKGEWIVGKPVGEYKTDYPIYSKGGYELARTFLFHNGKEPKANAHLISASPDLYEACKKIMSASKYWQSEVEHIEESAEALNSATKAIAKANQT